MNTWHPSFIPATPANLPTGTTAAGCAALDSALGVLKSRIHPGERQARPARSLAGRGGWRDTPEPFRRLVVRSAGLSVDVAEKVDRDLTEAEKAAIREAARRLKERAELLVTL